MFSSVLACVPQTQRLRQQGFRSKLFTWEWLPGSTSGREGTSVGWGQQPSSLPLRAAGACPAGKPGTGETESCPRAGRGGASSTGQGCFRGPLVRHFWSAAWVVKWAPVSKEGTQGWQLEVRMACSEVVRARAHGWETVVTRQRGSVGPSGTPRSGTRWWPRESLGCAGFLKEPALAFSGQRRL